MKIRLPVVPSAISVTTFPSSSFSSSISFSTLYFDTLLYTSLGNLMSFIESYILFSIKNIFSCFWMYDGMLSPPPTDVLNYEMYVQETSYPINTALWYLRDFMIVVICSPILYFLIKRIGFFFSINIRFFLCAAEL